MYDNPIRTVMRRRGLVKAGPDATVRKVAKQMARRNAGAALVIERDRLVGIFTERDVAFRVVAAGLDPDATTLRERDDAPPADDRSRAAVRLRARADAREGLPSLARPRQGQSRRRGLGAHAHGSDLEEFRAEAHRRERYQR